MKSKTSLATDSPASGAGYAVFILTMMNLLNYLDRIIPSVVKDLFKVDLKLTDAQTPGRWGSRWLTIWETVFGKSVHD